MRKVISVLIVCILMGSVLTVAALAHGGHGSGARSSAQPRHGLCTVEGCTETGAHQHDGSWYCSQTGCTGIHTACTVAGCTEYGLHEHNSTNHSVKNHGAQGHSAHRGH